MMLSDSKLLARLKEELDGMAAPVQSDAQIFQSKITEASERQEVKMGPLRCRRMSTPCFRMARFLS